MPLTSVLYLLMKKAKKIILFISVISIILLFALFFIPTSVGSEYYAQKWSARFENISSIEQLKKEYPNIEYVICENGEWLFGISSDSHFNPWGGTIVLKDSNGKISAYFGHVCGPNFLKMHLGISIKSLNEFYMHNFIDNNYSEYKVTN